MRITFLLALVTVATSACSSVPTEPVASAAIAAAPSPISVEVQGAGPDVILIPGLASSTAVWSGLVERLRATHRVHLVQLAGFAGQPPITASADPKVVATAAEAVAGYITKAKLKSPAVVGHSLGGELGLMLAARHPNAIGRLMVVDALPFYSLLFDPAATPQSVAPQAKVFRDSMLAAPKAQADAMQAGAIARLTRTESAKPDLIAAGIASDRQTVAAATYELMTTDLRPELAAIKVPVKIVYAYDPSYGVPASQIDNVFQGAYGGTSRITYQRIDESLHFIMLDQPEKFESTVVDFLGDAEAKPH